MEFIIDRTKWLRGEGDEASQLLRECDGKMCCMGQVAMQLGATAEQIKGRPTLMSLRQSHREMRPILEDANLLAVGPAYALNDDKEIDDTVRESELKAWASDRGHTLRFIN